MNDAGLGWDEEIEVETIPLVHSLITDRTEADVARWRELRDKGYASMTAVERKEWDGGLKGAYKTTDLNRVGESLKYLLVRLSTASYLAADTFVAKTDWAASDVPTASDLSAYLRYVSTIREAMAQFPDTPPTPAYSGGLSYEEANNIEKILVDVDALISNMLAARHFCGELYGGEI